MEKDGKKHGKRWNKWKLVGKKYGNWKQFENSWKKMEKDGHRWKNGEMIRPVVSSKRFGAMFIKLFGYPMMTKNVAL